MALVTPVLLLILAGIFDFGFLFRELGGGDQRRARGRAGRRAAGLRLRRWRPGEARVAAYLTASGLDAPAAGEVVPTVVDLRDAGGNDFRPAR